MSTGVNPPPSTTSSTGKKTVGKYEIGKTLGEGTFGKVKHAINTETGEEVAIKVLDKERIAKQSMGAQIKKEISIMKQLEHPNIVKLKEVLASRTKIFIVLELVTGGELFDLIVKSGRLNENDARYYFRQLVEGVAYCHSKGVAHRDLKPENLLLDAHGTLKISDFGLSALYDDPQASRSELLHTTCGTPNYVAPEVLQNLGYDGKRADCWSVGVVLYVLLAGFLPFDETTMSALFAKIKAADFGYPHWFSKPVLTLLDSLLVADPASRASLTELLANPWVAAPISQQANTTERTMDQQNKSSATPSSTVSPGKQYSQIKTQDQTKSSPQSEINKQQASNKEPSSGLNKHESSRQVSLASKLPPIETIDALEKALQNDERLQQLTRPEQNSLEASIATASGLVSLSASTTHPTPNTIATKDSVNSKTEASTNAAPQSQNIPPAASHLCIIRGKG